MRVYILSFEVEYEGSSIEGVFSTRKNAEKAMKELKKKYPDRIHYGEKHTIKMWRVTE